MFLQMPPACPGELHVPRYIQGYFPDPLSHSPAAKPPVSGKKLLMDRCCSNNRNDPPDKPGAFEDSPSWRRIPSRRCGVELSYPFSRGFLMPPALLIVTPYRLANTHLAIHCR